MLPFRSLTSLAFTLPGLLSGAEQPAPHRPGDAVPRILLTGSHPGAGARREAVAEALSLRGVRCLIGAQIDEPFATHCVARGILPIVLAEPAVRLLWADAAVPQTALMTVDLQRQEIVRAAGGILGFRVDPFIRRRLLAGRAEG